MPRLDIRALRRAGLIQPGAVAIGTQAWSRGGEDLGHASLRLDLTRADSALLMVAYAEKDEVHRQQVAITSRPMRYGGERFYFICPETERPCEVLALVDGVFASRRAHRLAYRSQSEDRLSRARGRADRLGARLAPGDRGRPRAPNRQRLEGAWFEAECAFNRLFDLAMSRLRPWL